MEKRYVFDTSAIIGYKEIDLDGEIYIPRQAISELYYFAEQRLEKGIVGLENLLNITRKYKVNYIGDYIKNVEEVNIDIQIIEIAKGLKGILVTRDKAQEKLAQAFGVETLLIKPKREGLIFEDLWDESYLSMHIKEDQNIIVKVGAPGNIKIEELDIKLSKEELTEELEKIYEVSKIERESEGMSICQYKDFRILITIPPTSERIEITIVRPREIKDISYYNLDKKVSKRLETAEGILIAGKPGEGKSTFAKALINFYLSKNKIVKTVESPRDLDVDPKVTQYLNKNPRDVIDILLLARPDYTIFDEVRSKSDFDLYTELRLAGVGMVGVLHASKPIEAIQRFIGKIELGMIPHVIDTVIFIEGGKVTKILSLEMMVKVPFGMTESDLARPVIQVKDFVSNKILYEIFKFGEETCIIEVDLEEKLKILDEKLSGNYSYEIKDGRIILKCSKNLAKKLLANKGQKIKELERLVKMPIDIVKDDNLDFEIYEEKNHCVIKTKYKKKKVRVYVDGQFIGIFKTSKSRTLKIPKLGKDIKIELD